MRQMQEADRGKRQGKRRRGTVVLAAVSFVQKERGKHLIKIIGLVVPVPIWNRHTDRPQGRRSVINQENHLFGRDPFVL